MFSSEAETVDTFGIDFITVPTDVTISACGSSNFYIELDPPPAPKWYQSTSALPGFPEESRVADAAPPRRPGVNLGMRWREYERQF